MEWNTAAIRDMLSAAFSDQELTTLCFDYFRPVYEDISSGMSKRDKIQRLLDYSIRQNKVEALVRVVEKQNPAQYARFGSQLKIESPVTDRPTGQGETSATSATPPASPTREIGWDAAVPAGPPVGPIRNRWALLVGINTYVDPAFPQLHYCVNDVLALDQLLKSLGYTVVTLHDHAAEERLQPTRDNVEAELARLCRVADADDLLLVHLACHGTLVNGKPVIITREIRELTLQEKALPLEQVERRMRASKARRLVITLDACHTGVEMGRDLADPAFIRNAYELAEGFALMAASTSQQKAQEWQEKQHGVFTYYLLQGLGGQADQARKGLVTVDDLKTYVLDNLRRWNVKYGGLLQEPTARTEGLGDIILADYRDRPLAPP